MLEKILGDESLSEGFQLLEARKYERARDYFEKRLNQNALAYYGMATSLFRKSVDEGDFNEDLNREIIGHYEKSKELDGSSTDTMLMLGMAYERRINILFYNFRKHASVKTRDEIGECIEKAKESLEEAKKLNENYQSIVDAEIKTINRQGEIFRRLRWKKA